ncbi:MAG TPA: hypothetical protein VEN29_13265 [Casimicrobiaceae bacterium]|nr:hypothetical protein [Casimicrobiaceae bacterium]
MARAKRRQARRPKYWVQDVKTTAIVVPERTMTGSAQEIADTLCKHNRGKPATSINRFIQFYLNRGGRGIPETRKRTLKQAMALIRRERPRDV